MDKKQALARAMALCSQKEYSTTQIRSKLQLWEVAEADADSIVEELVKEKFIDDFRFAAAYVSDKVRFNQWGRIKIRYMLSMERISHSVIDQALGEMDEEAYGDALRDILQKKARQLKGESNPFSKRQKLIRFAQGRGFEVDLIMKQMKDLEQ